MQALMVEEEGLMSLFECVVFKEFYRMLGVTLDLRSLIFFKLIACVLIPLLSLMVDRSIMWKGYLVELR